MSRGEGPFVKAGDKKAALSLVRKLFNCAWRLCRTSRSHGFFQREITTKSSCFSTKPVGSDASIDSQNRNVS